MRKLIAPTMGGGDGHSVPGGNHDYELPDRVAAEIDEMNEMADTPRGKQIASESTKRTDPIPIGNRATITRERLHKLIPDFASILANDLEFDPPCADFAQSYAEIHEEDGDEVTQDEARFVLQVLSNFLHLIEPEVFEIHIDKTADVIQELENYAKQAKHR